MSRLIALFPRAWRERYEAEFLTVLAERPPTVRDRLDIVRGALDAHANPHLVGNRTPMPWTHRVPGLVAASAGLMWTAVVVFEDWRSGAGQGWASLVPLSVLAMAIVIPGDYLRPYAKRVGLALALFSISVAGANALPWPWMLVPWLAAVVIGVGGMLAVAAVRAGLRAAARWVVVAVALGIPAAALVPQLSGLIQIEAHSPAYLAALLPLGLVWLALGARMAILGAPTIVDESQGAS